MFQIIKMFSQNEIWTPIVPSLVGEQEGQNKINLYIGVSQHSITE